MAAETERSKERTKDFYIELTDAIQRRDGTVRDRVDAHEKKEEWLRLNQLRKMLVHLVDRGVGRYVPGLLTNLEIVVSTLNGK